MNQATWAEEIARKLLEVSLPRRWSHVQGVAARARSLASLLGDHADLLETAAWLHDIGYSPELADTGFHPLDGARYLRATHHADDLLCRLVAHHSCAIIEAEERGLADTLSSEFMPVDGLLADALIYCDMSTGPDGQALPVEQRLAEIAGRYGPEHLVTRSIRRSSPLLIAAVRRVQTAMRQPRRQAPMRLPAMPAPALP
jgi:HD superfamily phosphodiesterase